MPAISWSFLIAAPVLAAAVAVPVLPFRPGSDGPPPSMVMPQYDKARALLLPENYLEWVFVGSSLGLSYSESAGGHEMFNETLMEPTAYRHFVKTGEFREGTMFVLILHGAERAVLPGRRGQFAGDVHGVEMAVKDRNRTTEGWAYYGFGGMGGSLEKAAQPEAGGPGSCASRATRRTPRATTCSCSSTRCSRRPRASRYRSSAPPRRRRPPRPSRGERRPGQGLGGRAGLIMMCAPALPGYISHGPPGTGVVEIPVDSGVAYGV